VAIVAARGSLKTQPGPAAPWSEVTSNLGWLLLGSVFAAGLINAGPLALEVLRGDQSKDLAADFGKGVIVGRVPLFLFQAVQAALLPRLAGLAVRGQYDEFRQGFKRLLAIVIGVGVLGIVAAALVGPLILRTVFKSDLSSRTITLLVLGTSIYMIALTFAQAVIALHGHALVAVGWGAGMLTFVLVTWLSSDDLYLRVELGLVASSIAAAVVFALSLRSRLRHGAQPDTDSLIEARIDLPFQG
jgi:O-antigen/teichoic acid export membrane protein